MKFNNIMVYVVGKTYWSVSIHKHRTASDKRLD